jgi:hypothetical protein
MYEIAPTYSNLLIASQSKMCIVGASFLRLHQQTDKYFSQFLNRARPGSNLFKGVDADQISGRLNI